MKRVALIDSGPLNEIVKPQPSVDVSRWLKFIDEKRIAIRVPEIIDYELRREIVLQCLIGTNDSYKSLHKLNKYRQTKRFISINPSVTLTDACEIWAKLREKGQGTSDNKNIDVDVILAAQAISMKNDFDEVIIVTGNLSDIQRFCYLDIQVWDWKQALNDCKHNTINFYQELPKLL
jgi:predicted nucleic acid-binding protein